MSQVKDAALAPQGKKKLALAAANMPVVEKIAQRFETQKPFAGKKIACCLHVTKETAILMRALKRGGAEVALCGSNPLSTQDDVAAALAEQDIHVYAWRGINNEDYYKAVNQALDIKPDVVIDDGADLINTLHTSRRELLPGIVGGQEETTTGVIRLKAMAADKKLEFAVIAVNDSRTKHWFDNFYGTAQGTLDAIMRSTNTLISGKTLVVAGYGWCGKGMAQKARGMGANVIVCEVDPVLALVAHMDGFSVKPMDEAARVGDIFVTVTGDKDVLRKRHFESMKDGAILANSGHFDCEINVQELRAMSASVDTVRDNLEAFSLEDGRTLYLIGQGRLSNLAAAEGHSSEIMDLSFADQALAAEFLFKNAGTLAPGVHVLPDQLDRDVAQMKLDALGVKIDVLTPDQEKYLQSWQEGT
ncbi:MAG: adenosylhomocysteinase [Candidatus Micrarchaeota archaeon]|nr:adenosylhomocysteinase [Candidatus Micrarchaeota archaeon]